METAGCVSESQIPIQQQRDTKSVGVKIPIKDKIIKWTIRKKKAASQKSPLLIVLESNQYGINVVDYISGILPCVVMLFYILLSNG